MDLLRRHNHIVIDAGAVLDGTEALVSIRLGRRRTCLVVRHGARHRRSKSEPWPARLSTIPTARRAPGISTGLGRPVHPQPFRSVKLGI